MKFFKAVFFFVLVGIFLFPASSSANVPLVLLSFDYPDMQYHANCPDEPPGTVVGTLYVVARNFDMWMAAIEYRIEYPSEIAWLGDILEPTQLSIGATPDGIGITWPIPVNAFGNVVVQKAFFLWMCQGCPLCSLRAIKVRPYPSSGKIRALRWPDLLEVQACGGFVVICPRPVPIEETTWGRIKAMYR